MPLSLRPASVCISMALMLIASGCSENPGIGETHEPNPDEFALMGGTMTLDVAAGNAFTHRSPNLTGINFTQHEKGRFIYQQNFVPPPATLWYGLGPVYSNSSCKSCHVSGGRGKPLAAAEPPESMMMRISVSGSTSEGGPKPVTGFGLVLQTRNTGTVAREGNYTVFYEDVGGSFDDGEQYTLRKPRYIISNTYQSFPSSAFRSARVSEQLVGLGLLEAITDEDIKANADENDANGDGISGRVNMVYNILSFSQSAGRFGWKASSPTIKQQAAFDFNEAMGVTSSLSPYNVEPCHGQIQAAGQELDDPEIQEADAVRPLNIYLKTTAVPKRRSMNNDLVRRGQKLFIDGGCISCHIEKFKTGNTDDIEEVRNQTIYPYTDLLLHDMGDGLSDGRAEFLAAGNEWRTPPLWGIGLTEVVSGATYFLHDGRARNLVEAILWHGGEGKAAKEFFRKLPKKDRDAIVAFLNSL